MLAKEIVARLMAIQDLDELIEPLQPIKSKGTKAADRSCKSLRVKLPEEIREQYDRLRARGRKGIASAEGYICRSCHLAVPSGLRQKLDAGSEVVNCPNCGAFLHLSALAAPTQAAARLSLLPKPTEEAQNQTAPSAKSTETHSCRCAL